MTLSTRSLRSLLLGATLLTIFAGCAGRPQILPNQDKALRKTSAEFAADAAKRHPFKADAPSGGVIAARAQVGYMADVLDVANLSDTDWNNVEVWVNKAYVVHIPLMEKQKLKHLTFQMLFNDSGQSFPINNQTVRIESVQLYMDGKMFDVTTKLAD
jgi:hypothetical protein